jgi:LuxR family maltose regulon positive regulatory protein
VPDVFAVTLCERSLVAIARGRWNQAETLAREAAAVLREVWADSSSAMPLVCAVQARVALHRADVPTARRVLVEAQRSRPLLTYAEPHLAVQARIELIRVHLALGDLAGARMLMREINDVLKRRPGLGTLVGETGALQAQLSKRSDPDAPGASALTSAELRLLPLLSTHMSFAEIGRHLFLSPNTVKTQAVSIYRKVGASTRSQAVSRSRELGLLEG